MHDWLLKNVETGQVIKLEKASNHVGRNGSAEIVCRSCAVSRSHAEFVILSNGTLRIHDFDSANGTFVNNKKIPGRTPVELKHGDEVGLGLYRSPGYATTIDGPHYIFKILQSNLLTNDTQQLIEILDSDEEEAKCVELKEEVIEIEDHPVLISESKIKRELIEIVKKEPLINYSVQDISIVLSDDDDEEFLCSQLFKNDDVITDTLGSDNMFTKIKQELTELDKLEGVPNIIDIDNEELDWNVQDEEGLQKILLSGLNDEIVTDAASTKEFDNELSYDVFDDELWAVTNLESPKNVIETGVESESGKESTDEGSKIATKTKARISSTKKKSVGKSKKSIDKAELKQEKQLNLNASLLSSESKEKKDEHKLTKSDSHFQIKILSDIKVHDQKTCLANEDKKSNKSSDERTKKEKKSLSNKGSTTETDKLRKNVEPKSILHTTKKVESDENVTNREPNHTDAEKSLKKHAPKILSESSKKNTEKNEKRKAESSKHRRSSDSLKSDTSKKQRNEDTKHTESHKSDKDSKQALRKISDAKIHSKKNKESKAEVKNDTDNLRSSSSSRNIPAIESESLKTRGATKRKSDYKSEITSKDEELPHHSTKDPKPLTPSEAKTSKLISKKPAYVIPPIIPAHVMLTRLTKTELKIAEKKSKRKCETKAEVPSKKCKKVDNLIESRRTSTRSTNKTDIKELRTEKLKEIASKSPKVLPAKKEQQPVVAKISGSRGSFLLEDMKSPTIKKPIGKSTSKKQPIPATSTSTIHSWNIVTNKSYLSSAIVSPADSELELESILNAKELLHTQNNDILASPPCSDMDLESHCSDLEENFLLDKVDSKTESNRVIKPVIEQEASPSLSNVSSDKENKEVAKKDPRLHRLAASKVTVNGDYRNARQNGNEFFNITPQINNNDIIFRILNWRTNWLDEQRTIKKSPPVWDKPPVHMKNSFKSHEDYYATVNPLLLMELWHSIYKDYENTSFKNNKDMSIQAMIEAGQKNHDETQTLSCSYYTGRNSENVLKEEDLVLIQVPILEKEQSKISHVKIFGYVTHRTRQFVGRKNGVKSAVNAEFKNCINMKIKPMKGIICVGKHCYVRHISSLTSSLRIMKSAKYLKYSALCSMVLSPSIQEYKIRPMPKRKLFTKDKLNEKQTQAVLEGTEVCIRPMPGIYLIQGPPGTGKSTVITGIVQEIIYGNYSKNNCVLLVAPSNAAVDELTIRLISKVKPFLTDAQKAHMKIVRMGPRQITNPDVALYSLNTNVVRRIIAVKIKLPQYAALGEDWKQCKAEFSHKKAIGAPLKDCQTKYLEKMFCIEDAIKKDMGPAYNTLYKQTETAVLSGANIICTTLSSCIRISLEELYRNLPQHRTCCIIDEATQSAEQETLIPLILGINRIILVGDPQQLPATTLSMDAKNLGYGNSLFARIQCHLDKEKDNPINTLEVQYRMHPEIAKYPNMAFYKNILKNSDSYVVKKELENLNPYVIFNMSALNFNNDQYVNKHEADAVARIICGIQNMIKTQTLSIGVITPYNAQKDEIKKRLTKEKINAYMSINVNTVDSFQGQEKDIIIISCVRYDSNSFVADEKRLNVAVTRAKYGLYIIGSNSLFKSCLVLGKLYDDAESRNCLFNISTDLPLQNYIHMLRKKRL